MIGPGDGDRNRAADDILLVGAGAAACGCIARIEVRHPARVPRCDLIGAVARERDGYLAVYARRRQAEDAVVGVGFCGVLGRVDGDALPG